MLSPLATVAFLSLLLPRFITPFTYSPPLHSRVFCKAEAAKFAQVRLVVCRKLGKILRLNSKERIRHLVLPIEALRANGRKGSGGDLVDTAIRQSLPVGDVPYVVSLRERKTTSKESSQQQSPPFIMSSPDQVGVVDDSYFIIDIDHEREAPPDLPKWLHNLPPHFYSTSQKPVKWVMLSFYRFFEVEYPGRFAEMLRALWRPLRVLGRVYVAKEGVNAQMAVQEKVLEHFRLATDSAPGLNGVFFNLDDTSNVLLQEGTVEKDEKSCTLKEKNCEPKLPFKNLHIRARKQIVSDGYKLDEEQLDCTVPVGKGLTPSVWHDMVDRDEVIVLDCRNAYESAIGRFASAVPLDTTYFRDTWDALPSALEGVPQDAQILTYCTGGIRCEKVAAHLVQKLGYTNVMRLNGGIVNYASHCRKAQLRSKFLGLNYVFDDRMAERITDDSLAQCEMCGSPVNSHVNCANVRCHTRFLQCHRCSALNEGCCSKGCNRQKNASSSSVSSLNSSGCGVLPWLHPRPFQNSFLNHFFDDLIEESSLLPDCQRIAHFLKSFVIHFVNGGDGHNKVLHIDAGQCYEAEAMHQEDVLKGATLDFRLAGEVVVERNDVKKSCDSAPPESYRFIHVEQSGISGAETMTVLLSLFQKDLLSRIGLLSVSLDDSDVLEHCIVELSKGWWKNNVELSSLDICAEKLLLFVRMKG